LTVTLSALVVDGRGVVIDPTTVEAVISELVPDANISFDHIGWSIEIPESTAHRLYQQREPDLGFWLDCTEIGGNFTFLMVQ
jgi:hypothetical protein